MMFYNFRVHNYFLGLNILKIFKIYMNFATNPETFFTSHSIYEDFKVLWEISIMSFHPKRDNMFVSWTRQQYTCGWQQWSPTTTKKVMGFKLGQFDHEGGDHGGAIDNKCHRNQTIQNDNVSNSHF